MPEHTHRFEIPRCKPHGNVGPCTECLRASVEARRSHTHLARWTDGAVVADLAPSCGAQIGDTTLLASDVDCPECKALINSPLCGAWS